MDSIEEKSLNDSWNKMTVWNRTVAKDVLGETKGKGMISKETWSWNGDVQKFLKEKKDVFKYR